MVHPLGAQHVGEGIVEGSEIRVHLFIQGSRQEAEALTGLDCWAGEDDTTDLFGPEGLHRLGYCQIGLAGSRRSDTESDGMRLDG